MTIEIQVKRFIELAKRALVQNDGLSEEEAERKIRDYLASRRVQ